MMTVALSGSHGLMGSVLASVLPARGDRVVRLIRGTAAGPGDIAWNPAAGRIDAGRLDGVDAVIHLAGENVAGRWTPERKRRIRDSRVHSTRLLAETLARLTRPPRVLISASATGYYGSRGSQTLREDSPPGTGFLAEVCLEWEAAADPARRAGIRVVRTRFGIVLSPRGGILGKILPLFRLGLGGPIGTGRQYISWIAMDDLIAAMLHLLAAETVSGPVNMVSPRPVTNAEFTRAIGRAVSRPAVLPVPAGVLRMLFGEMADDTLLTSERVEPARLLASGFVFRFPEIDSALRHLLH